MLAHKRTSRIFIIAMGMFLLLMLLFMERKVPEIQSASQTMGYEDMLFDTSSVHTVEIVMEGWDDFIESCENKEYAACSVVIDNEVYKNVGIRAKGSSSMTVLTGMDSDRYSFKIEFDKYDSSKTYHGLDKLCLNNLVQDNTMMKDYLTYQLMASFGVNAPLCSYVYITVNEEDWGMYLAVEDVEDGFLRRNYRKDYGKLYKPDSGESKEICSGGVKLQYVDDESNSYFNIFDNAKTDVTVADKRRLIEALKTLGLGDVEQVLDVDQVLRYFVVHNFVVNRDSYTGSMIHNYYLYEQDGLLAMIPWDYNLAFGTFPGNSASNAVNDPIDTPLYVTGNGERPMVDWIFASKKYAALYHQYFKEFLRETDCAAIIEEAYVLIIPYVEHDPTKFCTNEEFKTAVTVLKEFCVFRAKSVSAQLDGTIPSTDAGQNADCDTRIDASSLNLSDMGTINAMPSTD